MAKDERKKKEHAFSITTFRVDQKATEQIKPDTGKKSAPVALGYLGGLKDGNARASNL